MCFHIQCCCIIGFLDADHYLSVIYQVRQRLRPMLSHQLGVGLTNKFFSLLNLSSNLLSSMSIVAMAHCSDTKQARLLTSLSQSCELHLLRSSGLRHRFRTDLRSTSVRLNKSCFFFWLTVSLYGRISCVERDDRMFVNCCFAGGLDLTSVSLWARFGKLERLFMIVLIDGLVDGLLKILGKLGVLFVDLWFYFIPILSFFVRLVILENHMLLHVEKAVVWAIKEAHSLLYFIVWHHCVLIKPT